MTRKVHDYQDVYDRMYGKHGYRRQKGYFFSHGDNVDRWILEDAPGALLDVGCAHGARVERMRSQKIDAWGIEVSSVAVRQAYAMGRYEIHQGSVLDMPYDNNAFECVVATDVMEHIEPDDVESAISEMVRVCSRRLVLRIPEKGKGGGQRYLGFALHRTLRKAQWWIEQFQKQGHWNVIKLEGIEFMLEAACA